MRKALAATPFLLALVFTITFEDVAQAALIRRSADFSEPKIAISDGVTTVSVTGCPEVGLPGEPLLPAHGMCVLLPQGEEVVSVSAMVVGETEIGLGFPIECAQRQYPLSMEGPYERTLPDEDIYGGTEPFPQDRVVHVSTEVFRGYNLAFLRVYPVTYVGGRNALRFAPSVRLTIETQPSDQALTESFRTLRGGNNQDVASLESITDDVSEASSYRARQVPAVLTSIVNAGDSYPYVIITNSTLKPVFENLKSLKDEQGYKTKIVLVSQISSNYSGSDLQTKIRNFIIDAYQNWESEFVMLGGDDDIIPHRGLYAENSGTIDMDIAADLYYMALDGNWNTDGDAYWGEPAEADLLPEISCGRAAVGTVSEATNFINKIIKYERTPVTGQIRNALMVGELLWDDPTWGCDYKDEIRYGSSNHGYTTVGFPPSFTVGTLYDRDLYPDSWDKEDLIPLMNGGKHIINHDGHSNVTYGLRMENSDIETRFTNNGVSNTYSIIYTQGCYSGSFDNRTSGGSYTDDCIGEHFCFIENGAVAFVGNSRYGWGSHASTNGANQYYDRQFFDAIFGENITALGLADVDSRVDNIPYVDAIGRWVYYELVVLGDPAMDIWTDVPGNFTAIYPQTLCAGQNEIAVRVLGSGPVGGARVSIFTDSTYSYSYTDAQGYAYVHPTVLNPGKTRLAISAHNFHAYDDTLDVVQASRAFVVLEDFPIDDDNYGGSSGNANGGIDAGETIESLITLRNIGHTTATSVRVELACDNPYVTVLDTMAWFPTIAPSGHAVANNAVRYTADPEVPDGEALYFEIDASCADTTFTSHVSYTAMAPLLEVQGVSYTDYIVGNGNNCIEPGETFTLSVLFRNDGSGSAEDVSVFLSSNDPHVTVVQDSSYLPTLPSGNRREGTPDFVVHVDRACPAFHVIPLDLDLRYASGRQDSAFTSVSTGGLLTDDMEQGEGSWTHGVGAMGYVDEWHLDTYRNHTGDGYYSWKCGGPLAENYDDYSNGALVTPELCLGPDASLRFWHYMDAELYGEGTNYAWDGGIVEISTNGGYSWTQITPVGGYPHRIYPNDASPFAAETPCFGATTGWEQEAFDLSSYTGGARIRFQFGSDGSTTGEGWYIDDVEVAADVASIHITPDEFTPVPAIFALRIADKNPVMSGVRVSFDVPRRAAVAIGVFDVRGRSVATLIDSVVEPGTYSREWDTGRLSPGVYFLNMKTADFQKTLKVLAVR